MAKARDKETLRQELNKHVQKKKWTKAIDVLQQMMQLGPADSDLRLMLGDLYLRAGRNEEAVREYSRAANEYAAQGELIKAISVNKMVVKLSPSHQENHARLAELYRQQRVPSEFYTTKTDTGKAASVRKPVPLFGEISAEEFGQVVNKMILHHFPKDTTVCKQGEEGTSFFVISSGSVKVMGRDADNREIELARLQENDFFGEIAALSGQPRMATVTTLEDSEILELRKADLDEVAKAYTRVSKIIQRFYESRVEYAKKIGIL